MNDPLLEMQEVRKSFPAAHGSVEVLHNVNLCVYPGEFVAITGSSGSGKSTCLHLAALLDRATSGWVRFAGHDVSSLDERDLCGLRKQMVGMVFQNYCLLPRRSVLDNVLFRYRYVEHHREDAHASAARSLEVLGLQSMADRPVRLLSGGEMQRVAIARAITLRPRLLIADEPTGNLDRASTDVVMACFRQLNQSGITILLVTHNLELLQFCTRHVTCRDGSITN